MSGSKKLLYAAAGGAADPVYVDDIFSTTVWEGNATNRAITNGIDLSGEGGLVWIKNRTSALGHTLTDTARGANKQIYSHTQGSQGTQTTIVTDFNDDGFDIGTDNDVNKDGEDIVSWTFRKTEKFFDIVTYTGNGSARTISHNLGSTPGCIIIKKYDSTTAWAVYHRGSNGGSSPETKYHALDSNAVEADSDTYWNDTAPTATVFSVGTASQVNTDQATYVAYLFAHNEESLVENSDESIIKSGHTTADGSAVISVYLGWEPQWLMIKRTNSTTHGDWMIVDNIRPLHGIERDGEILDANENVTPESRDIRISAEGIGGAGYVASGTYIYIAIRRSHKPPEAGTDVFSPYAYQDAGLTSGSGTAANRTIINGGSNGGTGFPVDLFMHKALADTSYAFHTFDRLRGKGNSLLTEESAGHPTGDGASNSAFDFMEGVDVEYNGTMYYYTHAAGSRNHVTYSFKRAKGFFDIVTYSGNATEGRQLKHNLGAVPKLVIIKRYNGSRSWISYWEVLGNGKYMVSNGAGGTGQNPAWDDGTGETDTRWNGNTPTSSVIYLGNNEDVNGSSGLKYVAYIFGNVDGICKVGTYDSDGSNNIAVTTGFSPRFLLVKSSNVTTTDWLVFDTARGMTSNDDNKTLQWNDDNAELSDSDLNVYPSSTGFTAKRGSNELNSNDTDKSYIYLAIA